MLENNVCMTWSRELVRKNPKTGHVTKPRYISKNAHYSSDDFDINSSRCVSNQGTDLARGAKKCALSTYM